MDFTNTNLSDFIINIIKCNSIDDILDKCKTQSIKGFVFERLYDIIIKFGFCPYFPNSQFIHKIGNANNGKLKTLKNLNKYIEDEKICSGNSGGCSDITLQNKNDNTYIFISSKFPKSTDDITKEKSVDYYDIQNIVAMVNKNKEIYKNFDIYLVVPDKNNVLQKVKSSKKSSQYITDYIKEDKLLDKNDLNKYFLEFKADIIKNMKNCDELDYDELYLTTKDKLKLRFHQELITQKTSNLIEEGQKSFLWGCKCRSGKTYMCGGLIIKEAEKKEKLNVLIITPAPTETMPQFTDDLFNTFKDFNFFKIHNIEGSKSLKKLTLENDNIFVMSKQLLQKYINDDTIMEIKNLKLDLIFFDENHFSGTTDLSKDILNSYASKNTVKIYLTATYNKPLKEWNIPEDCQMYWDIEDEQFCKSILIDESNISKLKEKHNEEYINKTIKYYTDFDYSINDIFKSYEKMPDLHLITTMFDAQRYEIIKEKIMDSKYGFSFDVLFSLKSNKTEFNYNNEVKTILRYISGSNKEIDFKNADKSIFTRINKISSRIPFTQIWFLPSDNINEISNCLMKFMKEDGILKHYDVLCINRKNKELAKDVKDEINKQETIARENGKKGLILLAGNMLSLGITIDSCDIVMLMNNTLSADKVMQQMYRCMTQGENKKYGFVVDLNISRVLNTCVNYTIYKNSNSIEDKIKYLIENHLINIDVDMMENKKLDSDHIVKKLMDIWKDDPINSFKSLLRNLDNDYVEFDNYTQKLINNSFTNSIKDIISAKVEIKDSDDELQELPTGKEKVKTSSEEKDDTDDEKEEETKISFTKDVLPYIIPLTCILTIKNKNKDFIKMLNDIKEDKQLLEVFDEQCLIWWNKKDLVNFIQDIVSKFFDKNSYTYNISIQFKMSIQSLIDKPQELLELINECLKPKDIEKKKFGEVFTPMSYINNNMLDDLDKYYTKTYKKNIFEDEKLTWFDPAAGMGNFPIAIYYKLMEGLKSKISNDGDRKKHILEKMIYMSEYNKKNCFLIKQIFNINNEYNLNLYEGDSLKLDINKVFKLKSFNIIIGNPPYNKEVEKANVSLPYYNEFIEYYMNLCSILIFIIPSRWFSGGKGLDKFRKYMLKRTDIALIQHFDDASEIFGSNVDIKGGVHHFIKDSKYDGDCNMNGSMIELGKYDIFIDNIYDSVIEKVQDIPSITSIYNSQDHFKIQSNDARFVDDNKPGYIVCYVSQAKGFKKYIKSSEVKVDYNYWKVLTTSAAHDAKSGFGNIFTAMPNEVHCKTYISFKVGNKKEAESLVSYLKCKLPNFLLSIRKMSHNLSSETCKWIPLPPLDKEWTDVELYKYFKLSNNDIKLINDTNIVGYKDIINKVVEEEEEPQPKKELTKEIKKVIKNEKSKKTATKGSKTITKTV
jgi:hypothetical protein